MQEFCCVYIISRTLTVPPHQKNLGWDRFFKSAPLNITGICFYSLFFGVVDADIYQPLTEWQNIPYGKRILDQTMGTRDKSTATGRKREGLIFPLPRYHYSKVRHMQNLYLKKFPQSCSWRNVIWKEMLWGCSPSEADSLYHVCNIGEWKSTWDIKSPKTTHDTGRTN